MTIYIFYARDTETAKVIYKQGSAEQNMEVYEDVYLDIRGGQITIIKQNEAIQVLSVPISRTIIKYRDSLV